MAEQPRRIIHPELPDDPRGLIATGQYERALGEYAREYMRSLNEGDFYIASVSFEAMYQAACSLLSEESEEPLGRRFRAQVAAVIRQAVAEASERDYDREDFQINLDVCEQKYRPKQQRRGKAES